MRSFIYALVFVVALSTFASAELLIIANPLGQGKWGVLGSYLVDSSLQSGGFTGLSAVSIGGYAGYGITDKLDAYIQAGQMTLGSLPAIITSSNVTAYGAILKYGLIEEGTGSDLSVAFGVGTRVLTSNTTALGVTTTSNGNQVMSGLGASKVMIPFVPYGGLVYCKTDYAGSNSTQTDLTAGTAIAWSTQGAVYVEYTLQSINPGGGASTYTANQIGLGVGYKI